MKFNYVLCASLFLLTSQVRARTRNWQANNNQSNKPNSSEIFNELDSDSNGLLTFSEFTNKEKERFNLIDTNDDGNISESEFKIFMEKEMINNNRDTKRPRFR